MECKIQTGIINILTLFILGVFLFSALVMIAHYI